MPKLELGFGLSDGFCVDEGLVLGFCRFGTRMQLGFGVGFDSDNWRWIMIGLW